MPLFLKKLGENSGDKNLVIFSSLLTGSNVIVQIVSVKKNFQIFVIK
jgi:hypothetical protein